MLDRWRKKRVDRPREQRDARSPDPADEDDQQRQGRQVGGEPERHRVRLDRSTRVRGGREEQCPERRRRPEHALGVVQGEAVSVDDALRVSQRDVGIVSHERPVPEPDGSGARKDRAEDHPMARGHRLGTGLDRGRRGYADGPRCRRVGLLLDPPRHAVSLHDAIRRAGPAVVRDPPVNE
jgi:hypothetical protein